MPLLQGSDRRGGYRLKKIGTDTIYLCKNRNLIRYINCSSDFKINSVCPYFSFFPMENADIAKIFDEIADLLEIKGENLFRVRSYRNAALIISGYAESMRSIAERDEKELENIKGIGKSIHEKIVEILKTGKCKFHEELLKAMPPGVLELLMVSGVGPKKAQLLYKELGIKSVEELEKAAKEGKLRNLEHMGEKTEEKILKAVNELKSRSGRFRLSLALSYAEPLIAY